MNTIDVEKVVDALRLVLPMAKAYAAISNVGNNGEMIKFAESVLADAALSLVVLKETNLSHLAVTRAEPEPRVEADK